MKIYLTVVFFLLAALASGKAQEPQKERLGASVPVQPGIVTKSDPDREPMRRGSRSGPFKDGFWMVTFDTKDDVLRYAMIEGPGEFIESRLRKRESSTTLFTGQRIFTESVTFRHPKGKVEEILDSGRVIHVSDHYLAEMLDPVSASDFIAFMDSKPEDFYLQTLVKFIKARKMEKIRAEREAGDGAGTDDSAPEGSPAFSFDGFRVSGVKRDSETSLSGGVTLFDTEDGDRIYATAERAWLKGGELHLEGSVRLLAFDLPVTGGPMVFSKGREVRMAGPAKMVVPPKADGSPAAPEEAQSPRR